MKVFETILDVTPDESTRHGDLIPEVASVIFVYTGKSSRARYRPVSKRARFSIPQYIDISWVENL